MMFGRAIWVSLVVPLLLAATACVPQDGVPKAANTGSPTVSPVPTSQPVAPGAGAAATPKPLSTASPPATKITTDLTTPRAGVGTATYRCGNGGMITIQNLGSSLRVLGPDGSAEVFPASPANQTSRYQEAATHDAIVIDGREALVMKKGSTPQSCKR
ncbi:MAG: hypothetical protein E5Y00_17040 [Mesorhizobium sp.]|uniref:hypothetical protein n=1 Tax=Mesorhizobium sp. TaxID=1871066 RepID=UPI000FCA3E94|nr:MULTISPECIES: hypothetical protein [unclassified Mesorhizobium]RUW02342.1 hypothetical protein EOA49_07260 [Mesorhizobium sp. M1A.F.Ca.IN.020.04.1.1]RUW09136.1 hypothetical protein EOA53_17375 [Mesorhizobium sp. M1A.F.Ca.IN.020.03.1.1]RWF69394.1 MAG: hypothetical protein EOQ34_22260 [Mesorhizobium sp.]RWG16836.1 MAG: hypothetical protein EOQ58_06850 [Mesorhizobium sp.]RWG32444.1 MAG: hypothetical protein EOQ61_10930 [Mesorhizobium sp.]